MFQELLALDREEFEDALAILERMQNEGRLNVPGAIHTDLSIRGEWHAAYQIMLLSNNVILTFAVMEDDEGEYVEVAPPVISPWRYPAEAQE